MSICFCSCAQPYVDFQKWNERSQVPGNFTTLASIDLLDPMVRYSVRTALVLERFSKDCNILYASNHLVLKGSELLGRSFFDFVAPEDVDIVRAWIVNVKSWGKAETGQPSGGGFGFGKFTLCPRGKLQCVQLPFRIH